MATRTAAELWERLLDEAGEEEIERAAAVSVAQAEKELRAAGFDVKAERAAAEAFLADLEQPAAIERRKDEMVSHARVRLLRPEKRRPSTAILIAAAATTAAVGGGLLYAALHEHSGPEQPAPPAPSTANPSPGPVETPAPDLVAAAAAKRQDAFSACGEGRWALCADLLDQAKRLDPAGESDPRVVLARQAIDRGEHPPNPEDKPGPDVPK